MRQKVSAGAYFGTALAMVGFAVTFGMIATTLRFAVLTVVFAILALISFYGAWKRFYSPEVDHDAPYLYRENIALRQRIEELEQSARPRTLQKRQRESIAAACFRGLDKLKRDCMAAGWSEEDASEPLAIRFVAIGSESETLSYRRDLADTFVAGGFLASFSEWPSSGTPEYDRFRGKVAALHGNPKNVVRPFVLEALRSSGLEVIDVDYLPPTRGGAVVEHDAKASDAVTIVVGPRA
jgi:hypothetical protein